MQRRAIFHLPRSQPPQELAAREEYIELQREANDEQRQKIVALSRQLRPD